MPPVQRVTGRDRIAQLMLLVRGDLRQTEADRLDAAALHDDAARDLIGSIR